METDIALHFRDQLKEARAIALRDAEAFQEIVFVLERLGVFLAGKAGDLGKYKDKIVEKAACSLMANSIPSEWPGLHATFEVKYEIVRKARNAALHDGALARHLTINAVELSLILEEALMNGQDKVGHFMVRNPVYAFMWQPLSFIRQTMLVNSFSYLPVPIDEGEKTVWKLISDCILAQYLRGTTTGKVSRDKLSQTLLEVTDSAGIELLQPETCGPEETIEKALEKSERSNGLPILIKSPNDKHLLGILTPFDLL